MDIKEPRTGDQGRTAHAGPTLQDSHVKTVERLDATFCMKALLAGRDRARLMPAPDSLADSSSEPAAP